MSPTRKRLVSMVVACVMVAAPAIGAGPAPASPDAARTVCGAFTGPAWKSRQYHKQGTLYQVSAEKVSCSFALNWSKKLVRKASHGAYSPLPGPAGWHCYVHPGALDFTRAWAASGRCDKGSAVNQGSPVLVWFPKFA
jgi:hypothetical protein